MDSTMRRRWLTAGAAALALAGEARAADRQPVIGAGTPASGADETRPASTPPPPAPVVWGITEATEQTNRFSLQLNLDVASAYFFRGIRQEDRGFEVQPAARLTFNLLERDGYRVDAYAATWNSYHSRKTGAEDRGEFIGRWYEADGSGGVVLSSGKVSLTAAYVVLASPSNAFGTVQELDFTIAYDDSELLGAWALHPYAMIAIEMGSNASDGRDSDNGAYLELGIAPGLTMETDGPPLTLTFPVLVGLSLGEYYQSASGSASTFGYAQVGARASVPLPKGDGPGVWSVSAGVSALFLGPTTREFNGGHKTQFVGTVGVQVNF